LALPYAVAETVFVTPEAIDEELDLLDDDDAPYPAKADAYDAY